MTGCGRTAKTESSRGREQRKGVEETCFGPVGGIAQLCQIRVQTSATPESRYEHRSAMIQSECEVQMDRDRDRWSVNVVSVENGLGFQDSGRCDSRRAI